MAPDSPAAVDNVDWAARIREAGTDITRRILAEPIVAEPCHHIVIDNIFPDDLYAEIQARWPALSSFMPIGETGRSRGYNKEYRKIIELMDDKLENSLAPLDADDRAFWASMAQWLNSEQFVFAMAKKATPFLQARFNEKELAELRAYHISQLVVDTGEYSLGPHTDFAPGCVILLFYAPPDLSQRDKGTSLYLPKDRSLQCRGGPHHKFEDFDLIETVDFLPNRVFGFFKTNRSWHGVEPMQCDGDKRRVISWKLNLHLPPGH